MKLQYLIDYFKPILKYFKPRENRNYEDLKNYIQKKSAWIVKSLYTGILKLGWGQNMFDVEDEIFLGSINKAKWNIYSVALQDLCLFNIIFKRCLPKTRH